MSIYNFLHAAKIMIKSSELLCIFSAVKYDISTSYIIYLTEVTSIFKHCDKHCSQIKQVCSYECAAKRNVTINECTNVPFSSYTDLTLKASNVT